MPSHLSISSFKRLKGASCLLFTLLTFVLLYVPARVYIDRFHAKDGYGISDDLGIFLSGNEKPVIVISGSSRNGMSINEEIIEEAFPSLDCAKIAMAGATAYETLRLMEMHPDRFSRTKLIVVDIEPWQFNRNYLSANQVGNTVIALEKLVRKVTLQEVLDSLTGKKTYRRMDERWKRYAESPENSRVDEEMLAVTSADRFFEDFEYNKKYEKKFLELVQLCRKKNIDVLINFPPAQQRHIEQIRKKYSSYNSEFLKVVNKLNMPGVHSFIMEIFPPEYGTDGELFIDYGHMQIDGAKKYTEILVNEIKLNKALEQKLSSLPK